MISAADRETESTSVRREHCETFLQMLTEAASKGQPVPTSRLAAISRNHTARISNLRADGHDIVCENVPEHLRAPGKSRQTQYRYRGRLAETAHLLIQQYRGDRLIDTAILRPFSFACGNGVTMILDKPLVCETGDQLTLDRVA